MQSSWRHDKQNAIWTMNCGQAVYVVSEWEDAIFFPETAWHDVGLSVENCKRICEWHARIAALEAERDGLKKDFESARLVASDNAELVSRLQAKLAAVREKMEQQIKHPSLELGS